MSREAASPLQLLVGRLRHAATTAANDDYSKPRTVERSRHVDRIMAMREAADTIDRLSDAVEAFLATDDSFTRPSIQTVRELVEEGNRLAPVVLKARLALGETDETPNA